MLWRPQCGPGRTAQTTHARERHVTPATHAARTNATTTTLAAYRAATATTHVRRATAVAATRAITQTAARAPTSARAPTGTLVRGTTHAATTYASSKTSARKSTAAGITRATLARTVARPPTPAHHRTTSPLRKTARRQHPARGRGFGASGPEGSRRGRLWPKTWRLKGGILQLGARRPAPAEPGAGLHRAPQLFGCEFEEKARKRTETQSLRFFHFGMLIARVHRVRKELWRRVRDQARLGGLLERVVWAGNETDCNSDRKPPRRSTFRAACPAGAPLNPAAPVPASRQPTSAEATAAPSAR